MPSGAQGHADRAGAATGPALFARFAYPPNALGLCGPDDSAALLDQAAQARPEAAGLRHLARGFDGAWPYLQLIAGANGIPDPLDVRVVEAYWVGNSLLDRVPVASLGSSLDDRFRHRAGTGWSRLAEVLESGARPHHNFHVFCVYPWVGLLRRGFVEEPLRILDRCRTRWGTVTDLAGDQAVVRSRGLEWIDGALRLGASRTESVTWRRDGLAFVAAPEPGASVALHWDWLCDVLSPSRLRALRRETAGQLALVNDRVARACGL